MILPLRTKFPHIKMELEHEQSNFFFIDNASRLAMIKNKIIKNI